ncbi:hypothetical protein BKA93DRAFT_797657 [Sparassis latifolia]
MSFRTSRSGPLRAACQCAGCACVHRLGVRGPGRLGSMCGRKMKISASLIPFHDIAPPFPS